MRNEETIAAISTKIATHLSEMTGTHVPVVTITDIEHTLAGGDPGTFSELIPFMPYTRALPTLDPFAGPGSIQDIINRLGMYAVASACPLERIEPVWPNEQGLTPEEIAELREEEHLEYIPREFWPTAQDGTPRTQAAMQAADTELQVAYDFEPDEWAPGRTYQLQHRAELAARYLPPDFVPQGEGAEADAERELAAWGAMRAARDEIVRRARAAGVTKTRIHEITGISRATLDRIPGV
ncbi:hypothetical protein [Actinomadura litoris]|uniref:Uncharacterized protein n=1 Tax=Actinomadura litoris TaxID=2678616 RepID=A0A7K1LAC7_9ACTN|nr:hypothetical protein [Actinomadura litoris]MUN41380.1 hypothetical protein [Actinomadura litoris]